ncbi:MAG TPA: hypothetical protein DEA96_17255 [Leptospiraceae bacterium]|nr:hypothetical protein [Spirochaetaceae bacterium]HBS06720.1 hypothetical protein [Leptospiraceae bacterium]
MRVTILIHLFFLVAIPGPGCSMLLPENQENDQNLSNPVGSESGANAPDLAATRASESEKSVAPEHRKKIQLFILAGQSNMSGRGKGYSEDKFSTDSAVYVFGNDYRWKIARPPIDSSRDQLDQVSMDTGTGMDPSLPFAYELRKHNPDMIIGLVPCAMGATTMFEWERRSGRDSLYGSCLYRAKLASKMGTIKAVLFFQGEWDAVDVEFSRLLAENHRPPEKKPENLIQYSLDPESLPAGMTIQDLKQRKLTSTNAGQIPIQNAGEHWTIQLQGSRGYNRGEPALWGLLFADFVNNFRGDLQTPELPVIFAQIGDQKRPDVYKHWKTVQEAQSSINLENVSMIRTSGLPLRDSVHFTAESYLIIGQRFAHAYLHQYR